MEMNTVREILDELQLKAVLLVAGFAGSLVSMENSEKMTIKQGILRAISGTLTANYLTPVFMTILNLNGEIHNAIAFLIGFLGMKAIDFAWSFYKKSVKKDE